MAFTCRRPSSRPTRRETGLEFIEIPWAQDQISRACRKTNALEIKGVMQALILCIKALLKENRSKVPFRFSDKTVSPFFSMI